MFGSSHLCGFPIYANSKSGAMALFRNHKTTREDKAKAVGDEGPLQQKIYPGKKKKRENRKIHYR
jgi:hypothetical protein